MITLVNPNLVGFQCTVIDAFGENPNQFWFDENFLYRGLTPSKVVNKISKNSMANVLYAINLTHHRSLIQIIQSIRQRHPKVPIIVMENTQAVTAYSLRKTQEELYDVGVDYVITGEAEGDRVN